MLVNGVNLNVKTTGSGPGIVALHGFAGNMSTWAQFIRAAKRKYTVITIDLLGHGRSDTPRSRERYRVEHSIADIATALKQLNISPPYWLGYSMGGRIALAAAALAPESCSGLVLEGASPGLTSRTERAERRRRDQAIARLIMKEGVDAFTDYWEKQPLFDSQKSLPPSVRKKIRVQRRESNPLGLANTLRAANPGVQPPLTKLLPKIRAPVLCVVGEYDSKFVAMGKEMCRKLPNGRLKIVPHAGHAPHIERPREFNRIVLSFLSRLNW